MSFENLSGQFLGQYELRDALGQGGMGAVYRAVQPNLKRDVAIKILPTSLALQAGYLDRFTREAEIAAALQHPHIVPIIDYGMQRGISYVVMRLLTGGSLAQRINQRMSDGQPLSSLGEAAQMLTQLASALDYAHSQGVIHRDIKTSNIMFDDQGNAYVVDFGIAKLQGASQNLTSTGMALGTSAYMPPEQWRSEPLTPAADQYAMAVTMYILLTGRVPYDSDTPGGLMYKHFNEMPPPPQMYRADLPSSVSDVINHALAKRPEDRYANMAAFAQAFQQAISGHEGKPNGFFTFKVRGTPRPVPVTPISPPSGPSTVSLTPPVHSTPSDHIPTVVQPTPPPIPPLKPAVPPPSDKNRFYWGLGAVFIILVAAIVFLQVNRQPGAALAATPTVTETSTTAPVPTPTYTATMASIALVATAPPTIQSLPIVTATSKPPTRTPTPTLTATVTSSVTSTKSNTPTVTWSATYTATASATVTASSTATASTTYTRTPTSTKTATPTNIPSLTFTSSPTITSTWTPNITPTSSVDYLGAIRLGDTVSGELTQPWQIVEYSFGGYAGKNITLTVTSGDFSPQFVLFRVIDHTQVAVSTHLAGSFGAHIDRYTLEDWTYAITIQSEDGGTGSYKLSFVAATDTVTASVTSTASATVTQTPVPAATGTATAAVNPLQIITSTPSGPSILAFDASANNVIGDNSITLTWIAQADSARIDMMDAQGKIYQTFNVVPSGSLPVSVPSNLGTLVIYRLIVFGNGQQSTRAIPITVQVRATSSPDLTAVAQGTLLLTNSTPPSDKESIGMGVFEYGGQVTDPASQRAVAAMHKAGMTWMKIQFRFSPGTGPDAVAGQINDAKSRGFKILVSLVGYPADLAAGGDGYIQQFAQFSGGVAGLGPDAIEVWNEPNLDREWPAGQISGANYTKVLHVVYSAIKKANGNVMVISAAPAPTGAEKAFPGKVVNDDNFIRDMVNAGGLQYMDCLGAQYIEGVVAPTQNSGDPRDNYYTRYFGNVVDTYWSLIGGQKPICWTELGYLTSEGYGVLDPFFGWASNITIAEQAAWLGQAVTLSSRSGKVRLLIVYNIDSTDYGVNPMAGYAMIRLDGSCLACDAIASASSLDIIPLPTQFLSSTPSTPYTTTTQGINVRSGPSTLFNPPIGSLATNQSVDLLARSPDGQWFKIKYYNGVGWVFAAYTKPSVDPSTLQVDAGPPLLMPTPSPSTAVPAQTTANLVLGNVNINPVLPIVCGKTVGISLDVANLGGQPTTTSGSLSIKDIHVSNNQEVASTTGAFGPIQNGQTINVSGIFLTVTAFVGEQHKLVITLNPDGAVAETRNADNSRELTYTLGSCVEAGATQPTSTTTAKAVNLLINGGFEEGSFGPYTGRRGGTFPIYLPSGWNYRFAAPTNDRTNMGERASIQPHPGPGPDPHGGGRALSISCGYFTCTAAIYQTVNNIQSDTIVQASAWSQVKACNLGGGTSCDSSSISGSQTRIGIDPTGGSDPNNPTIIWSTWVAPHDIWLQQSISATAINTSVTVFLYSTQVNISDLNQTYWDDVSLTSSGSSGVALDATPAISSTSTPPNVAFVVPQSEQPDGSIIHIVQNGDTIDSIAYAYGTTRSELLRLNNLQSADFMFPGQKLIVRLPTKTAEATESATPSVPFVAVTFTPALDGSEGNISPQSGVDVLAYCDNKVFGQPAPTDLTEGATIDVFWSWFVRDSALIQQQLDNAIYDVKVDGKSLDNWQEFATSVRKGNDGNFYIFWYVPVGPLASGKHSITYNLTWKAQTTDGYDIYGPGTNKLSESGSCTFLVR